jgi:hypothetical protein
LFNGLNTGSCRKYSTQQLSGIIANNNQESGSPDPENKPKDNTKNSPRPSFARAKCIIKTPVFPSSPVKVYDDANSSKSDMLSDLKNQAVIYM